MKLYTFFTVLILTISAFKIELIAQTNSSYQIASKLIQQQQYEEALPLLENLHRQEPNIFAYLDGLVECHIQLKKYDSAQVLLENTINRGLNTSEANILLGKLYHLNGDTLNAFNIWENNLSQYQNQIQLYYNTVNILTERKEFTRAIDVLMKGRSVFNNDQLFLMDIPNIYMQAGDYAKAISEWLAIIEKVPTQAETFKQTLIRYNDPLLFEDSIAEIEFKLSKLSVTDKNYQTFYDLQSWLLLENRLYKRAFATALKYEKSTVELNYKLMLLARELVENNKFELAIKAFSFYTDLDNVQIKTIAYDEIADAYVRWAKYLKDYNLAKHNQIQILYNKSVAILDTLIQFHDTYQSIDNIYFRKAELSLDHVFNFQQAERAVHLFKSFSKEQLSAQTHYLDGRLLLAKNKFTQARIELTRSNRLAGTGQLAEKTRYFLALTDFYSGDFEFATIQLKTLSRRNTSLYANDALKLRLWLQEGVAMDTSGVQLKIFAEAMNDLTTNPQTFDVNILLDFIDQYPNTSLKDDILLILVEKYEHLNTRLIEYLNNFLLSESSSPLRENLLWLRADMSKNSNKTVHSSSENKKIGEHIFGVSARELYEQLIIEYPNGFYAPFARQTLTELPL
jgi:predicted Zn-dependent protease